jgi:hypothetical protein
MSNNITMPLSPVVDARLRAQPEWRRYLGATEESIKLLQTLIQGTGGGQVLSDRLSALTVRINSLTALAASQHERLVMWRGRNGDAGTKVSFGHGLGTRHVFWQIQDSAGRAFGGDAREFEQNEGWVKFRDDTYDPVPSGLDALFLGVISDRY